MLMDEKDVNYISTTALKSGMLVCRSTLTGFLVISYSTEVEAEMEAFAQVVRWREQGFVGHPGPEWWTTGAWAVGHHVAHCARIR